MKMDFTKFKKAFSNLGEISSVTGRASYISIIVSGNSLSLTRKNTRKHITISLNELYSVYQKLNFINTVILKDYISDYVYSPSLAVLIAAGFYDNKGCRIEHTETDMNVQEENVTPKINETPEPTPVVIKAKPKPKESDEERFFRIFAEVIGIDYLQAKGVDKPLDTDLVELPCDYRKLSFEPKMQLMLRKIIDALTGDFEFGNISLSSKIDGLIIDHPVAGTRIVEFDEEQHFTPPRMFSLEILSENFELPYFIEYLKICNDKSYLNSQVFPKHRISPGMSKMPANITEFKEWLEQHTKSSGYVEAKNGFPYHGGRISQRAYYDTLRDVAHLARENDHLDPPVRFAKKTFESEFNRSFDKINDEELAAGIRKLLWTFYDMKMD